VSIRLVFNENSKQKGQICPLLQFNILVCLFRRHNFIQHSIHRQLRQHHNLRNTLRGLAVRTLEQIGEVVQHDVGRAEGFDGVDQQGFAVAGRVGLVEAVGGVRRGHDVGCHRAEVVVEGAVGGFVESLRIRAFVGGRWVGFDFRWVRSWFEHDFISQSTSLS